MRMGPSMGWPTRDHTCKENLLSLLLHLQGLYMLITVGGINKDTSLGPYAS